MRNFILALDSFLILFLELALIRWVSTEIRIFAYLQNLVLLACFIGIGLGCHLSHKRIRLEFSAIFFSLVIILIVLPFKIYLNGQYLHLFRDIPIFLASFEDTVILYQKTIQNLLMMQSIGFAATTIIFFIILLIFIPLGQILGRSLENFQNPVKAYSVNVAASLIGIWSFNVLSLFYTPPWVWFLGSILLIGLLMGCLLLGGTEVFIQRKKICWKEFLFSAVSFLLALLAAGLMVSKSSVIPENRIKYGMTIWSPYQKLTLLPLTHPRHDPFNPVDLNGYHLQANNVGFMDLVNLSDPFIQFAKNYLKHPFYTEQIEGELNRFNFPFLLKKDAKSILILGGGAGNDAAGALRAGFDRIDVVEIDPGIYELGVRYHPEKPYSDPRVHVFVDDARAFLKKTTNKYDVIFFGLLDAHSQSSTMNSMRMDHYIYTQEGISEIKQLLEDRGVLIITYWVQRSWIAKRIEDIVNKVFGWEPFVVSLGAKGGLGPVMILSGHDRNNVVSLVKNSDPLIKNYILSNLLEYSSNDKIITDDWPYLYLRTPKIPGMYVCMIAVLMVIFLFGWKFFLKQGQFWNPHFFFLGAAFLLLEFQNINKTSLLFGMTWIVNSINISIILFLILAANFFVYHFRIKNLQWPYIFLSLSLLVNFLIPLSVYNSLPFWSKSFLAGGMLNLPVFFAGIVFAVSLADTSQRSRAFSSNFLGAVVGGLLEILSFVTGIKALIIITAVLYGLSWVFKK